MSVLKKYSRRPKFFYTLPSNNHFYNFENKEDVSILKEVGVMPLTIMNQMSLKNPEKLFNGSAIEEIIKDCTTITSIEPRELLKCDVDFLLVGIKIATNGDTEDIPVQCPKCESEMTQQINIEKLLTSATTHEDKYFVDINVGLDDDRAKEEYVRIYMRPYTFGEYMQLEDESFNEQKAITAIQMELDAKRKTDEEFTDEDERNVLSQVNNILRNLTGNVINIYVNAIDKVVILDEKGEETLDVDTDKESIHDFITNGIGTTEYKRIKDKFIEINSIGVDNIVELTCNNEECNHEFKYHYDINMSDFFGADS